MLSANKETVTRRGFVVRAAGIAAGASLSQPAASWAKVRGSNDRVRLGAIGVGSRGRDVLAHLLAVPNVEVIALADVYREALDQTVAKVGGSPQRHVDYRALLDNKDVDAVLIATPDHWHAQTTIDAVRAGKDVYVEKPLTRTLKEGERLVRAVKDSGRVVQVGLQQRSGSHYQQAKAEYFDAKRIGKLAQVRTAWYGVGVRKPGFTAQPGGLDWSRWLGPAKSRPFDADQFANWRWYWDFGGGTITDLFTHWVDVVHWFTGEDRPRSVSAMGGQYVLQDPRPAPDTVALLLKYPSGHTVSFDSSAVPSGHGWGIDFLGTAGRLSINRAQYTWTPAERGAEPVVVKSDEEGSVPHARNFIDSVRARKTPNSDVVSGHLSTRASLLARQAYLEKKQINLG